MASDASQHRVLGVFTHTIISAEGCGRSDILEITPERAAAGDIGATRRSNRIKDE